jgi:glycerol-3-phosphate acyltransferase PlsY
MAVSPLLGLLMLAIVAIFLPFKQLALGVLVAITSLPFVAWLAPSPLGILDKGGAFIGFLILFAVVIIRRLTPPRSEISRDIPIGELLLNRLLFDRDISNREVWINRNN